MMRKLFLRFILIVLFLCLLSGCDRPKMTGLDTDEIDTSRDPIQTSAKSDEPIIKEIKDGHFTITPVAEYKISGVVVSKKTYSSDWDGKISPVDLAIVWGKLAEPWHDRYITFWHGFRWYNYKWKEGSPFEASYIITHSSNNHIIPEKTARIIKRCKRKQVNENIKNL